MWPDEQEDATFAALAQTVSFVPKKLSIVAAAIGVVLVLYLLPTATILWGLVVMTVLAALIALYVVIDFYRERICGLFGFY